MSVGDFLLGLVEALAWPVCLLLAVKACLAYRLKRPAPLPSALESLTKALENLGKEAARERP